MNWGLLFFWMAVGGALGAAYGGILFRQMQRSLVLGVGVGAVSALAGTAVALYPLNYCTFEPERAPLDVIIGVLILLIGAGGGAWFAGYLSEVIFGQRQLSEGQVVKGAFRTHPIVAYLLLLPTLVILAVFLYYPALNTFRLSTLLARLGTPRTAFRCVTNFSELLQFPFSPSVWLLGLGILFVVMWVARMFVKDPYSDAHRFLHNWTPYIFGGLLILLFIEIFEPRYESVVFNTFVASIMIVAVGLVISLAIAYIAYQPVMGAPIYRTLLIWPYAVSPAVAGIIFSIIFHPTVGFINRTIESFGGTGLPWFTDTRLAMFTIIAASIWKTLGYNILFYIAGLQNVSKSLVEAAAIDGANGWQRFTNIVLPSLSPITFFLIITNITYAFFDIFGTIDFLTKGGPAGGTTVMIYQIYQRGIIEGDLGRAAAQSVVLFGLVIALTIFQFSTTGRRVTYGA